MDTNRLFKAKLSSVWTPFNMLKKDNGELAQAKDTAQKAYTADLKSLESERSS